MSSIRKANARITANNFSHDRIGNVLSWAEVSKFHKVRHGIYQRNGRLISLLTDFGRINPCYPDKHGESANTILYTGNGRRGDQKLDAQNRALLDAIASEIEVPLFNKLAPGQWEFMGDWRVIAGKYVFDEKQSRMVWKFTLQRQLS
ncbi:MAG: hypothetical protein ACKVQW_08930 [Pyrinomonadaceae bacterium]